MRSWLIGVAALGLLAGLAPLAHLGLRRAHAAAPEGAPSLAALAPLPGASAPSPRPVEPVDLAGLDLTHIGLGDDGATAVTGARRIARLTVDPVLQRTALGILQAQHLPEAAVVLIDPATGHVLVYASHVERGAPRDLCVEATAPAASLFKIVTAAALVDDAGLGPDTRQCYGGGEQRIAPSDLVDDPARDHWCVTLAGAMGRSVNAVFARLAQRHLTPDQLVTTARAFGFEQPLPFDVAVEPSALHVPVEPLAFARTAAGFWNTTLSPLHAAWISSSVARGGDALRPQIVRELVLPGGAAMPVAAADLTPRHVVGASTAQALLTMMEHTVSEGTSYRAFHDAKGTPFLPGMTVAGKTGTLTDDKAHKFFTWFTGFAPSRPVAGIRQVAIAALVVNDPTWRVKANVVAREMLQAYFAEQKVPGVRLPPSSSHGSD
jgi:cell division protein FtsI/penicillin-binding protein 2